METSIEQLIEAGLSAHKEADFLEAERFYRMVLDREPRNARANHHLGLIAAIQEQPSRAIPYFRVALEERPQEDICWISFIEALIRDEQVEAAQKALAGADASGVVGTDDLSKLWALLESTQ